MASFFSRVPLWRAWLFAGLFPGLVAAETLPDSEVSRLVATAKARQLAYSPSWLALGHYGKATLGSYQSRADEPAFFLSTAGKNDPQAELVATPTAAFSPSAKTMDDHAQCRFPARFSWLKKALAISDDDLPKLYCRKLAKWRQDLASDSVTLVFPAISPASPESMFGHTLLRLNLATPKRRHDLLGLGVNYAGVTGSDNGVLYAMRGLSGGYPGYFEVGPYYRKVQEYNDIEDRDIWEYHLNLTQDEQRRLADHLWELRSVRFDYFFLGENCAYQLLALIQAARPDFMLTDEFDHYTVPVDTVRLLVHHGYITDPAYRPSLQSVVRHKSIQATETEAETAIDLAHQSANPDLQASLAALPTPGQAAALELAVNMHDFMVLSGEKSRGDHTRTALLESRSRLPGGSPFVPVSAPNHSPDRGHLTGRARIRTGQDDGTNFIDLGLRPALHDLLDPADGYLEGASINILDTLLRVFPDSGRARLERLAFVDIKSLKPSGPLGKPFSWEASLTLSQLELEDVPLDTDHLAFAARGGAGFAWTAGGTLFAGTLGARLDASGALEESFRVAPIALLTVLTPEWHHLRSALYAEIPWTAWGNPAAPIWAEYDFRFQLTARNSIRLGTRFTQFETQNKQEFRFGWDWYF